MSSPRWAGATSCAFHRMHHGLRRGGDGAVAGCHTDAVTGQPAPCTVTITDAHGQLVQESAAYKAGFRSNGQFEKKPAAGADPHPCHARLETRAVTNDVALRSGEVTHHQVVPGTERGFAPTRLVRGRQPRPHDPRRKNHPGRFCFCRAHRPGRRPSVSLARPGLATGRPDAGEAGAGTPKAFHSRLSAHLEHGGT